MMNIGSPFEVYVHSILDRVNLNTLCISRACVCVVDADNQCLECPRFGCDCSGWL